MARIHLVARAPVGTRDFETSLCGGVFCGWADHQWLVNPTKDYLHVICKRCLKVYNAKPAPNKPDKAGGE